MNTLEVAAPYTVPGSASPAGRSAVVVGPWSEPRDERWPGWARLAVLMGSSAALWAGLVWAALQLVKLA